MEERVIQGVDTIGKIEGAVEARDVMGPMDLNVKQYIMIFAIDAVILYLGYRRMQKTRKHRQK